MGQSTPKFSVATFHTMSSAFAPLLSDDRFAVSQYEDFEQLIDKHSTEETSYILLYEANKPGQMMDPDREELQPSNLEIPHARKIHKTNKSDKKPVQGKEEGNEAKNHDTIQVYHTQKYTNLQMLSHCFGLVDHTQYNLKEQIISYLKRNSIKNLRVLLLVGDIYRYRVTEDDKAFIDIVTGDLDKLAKYIVCREKITFKETKFKRMLNDLHRKMNVAMIGFNKREAIKWEDAAKTAQLSIKFYDNTQDIENGFNTSTISTVFEFAIFRRQFMKEMIAAKQRFKLETNLVLFEPDNQLLPNDQGFLLKKLAETQGPEVAAQIWSVQVSFKSVIQRIADCSFIASQEEQASQLNDPLNIIMLPLDQMQCSAAELERQLHSQISQKSNSDKCSRLTFTSSNSQAIRRLEKSICSFVLMVNYRTDQIEEFKQAIRLKGLSQRVYVSKMTLKDKNSNVSKDKINQPSKALFKGTQQTKQPPKLKRADSNPSLQTPDLFAAKMAKDILEVATLKMKFQSSYINSIAVFRPQETDIKFLQLKMGLRIQRIASAEDFRRRFYPPDYREFIESKHIVCRISAYYNEVRKLIDEAPLGCYLKLLKVVISDSRENVQKIFRQTPFASEKALSKSSQPFQQIGKFQNPLALMGQAMDYEESTRLIPTPNDLLTDTNICFVHFDFKYIHEYLASTKIRKISIPYFGASKLSTFYATYMKFTEEYRSKKFLIDGSLTGTRMLPNELDSRFKNQITLPSAKFEFSFQYFKSNDPKYSEHINFYENKLFPALSNLIMPPWNILDEQNLPLLKEELKNCFYQCRMYELIQLTDEQFRYFYIDRIEDCENCLDLQIACIYIYTLPHGLSQVLSKVIRKPLQCCLAYKCYCNFILMLASLFYSFRPRLMTKLLMSIEISHSMAHELFRTCSDGDQLFNDTFLTISQWNEQDESQTICSRIVFQYEIIPHFRKSSYDPVFDMRSFSFYKGLTDFLLAPYSRLKVIRKKILENGCVLFVVSICHEEQDHTPFIITLLKTNCVSEEISLEMTRKVVAKGRKYVSKIKANYTMFQRSQLLTLQSNRQAFLWTLEFGLCDYDFYKAYNQQRYLSAYHLLQSSILQLEINPICSQMDSIVEYQKTKRAFIKFKMVLFGQAVSLLEQYRDYLHETMANDWERAQVESLMLLVRSVQQERHQITTRQLIASLARSLIARQASPFLALREQPKKQQPSKQSHEPLATPQTEQVTSVQHWYVCYREIIDMFSITSVPKDNVKSLANVTPTFIPTKLSFALPGIHRSLGFGGDSQQQCYMQIDPVQMTARKQAQHTQEQRGIGFLQDLFIIASPQKSASRNNLTHQQHDHNAKKSLKQNKSPSRKKLSQSKLAIAQGAKAIQASQNAQKGSGNGLLQFLVPPKQSNASNPHKNESIKASLSSTNFQAHKNQSDKKAQNSNTSEMQLVPLNVARYEQVPSQAYSKQSASAIEIQNQSQIDTENHNSKEEEKDAIHWQVFWFDGRFICVRKGKKMLVKREVIVSTVTHKTHKQQQIIK